MACILFMLLIGLPHTRLQAADRLDRVEDGVKAGYLYKFGDFVNWPERVFPTPSSAFVIGIIGADSLADELDRIAHGRTINGRPVTVRRLRVDEPITDTNVLFIGRSLNSRLGEILTTVKGQPTLTVTESDGGLALGSMVNFVLIDGKLRFEIAPKTAGIGNLAISARLLAAAYKVEAGAS
jgi:hypothetical protein